MRGKSEMFTEAWSKKDLAKNVIPVLIVVVLGGMILHYADEGRQNQEYLDCVDHFNSSDFSNETIRGNYVCVQDEEIYHPEVDEFFTGNFVFDILSFPEKILNLIPWWVEIPALILITLYVMFIASTIGPRP